MDRGAFHRGLFLFFDKRTEDSKVSPDSFRICEKERSGKKNRKQRGNKSNEEF